MKERIRRIKFIVEENSMYPPDEAVGSSKVAESAATTAVATP
jgi:hypothetical protein